jgi:hypothetical protein
LHLLFFLLLISEYKNNNKKSLKELHSLGFEIFREKKKEKIT